MKNNKLFIAIFVLVCLIFSVILLCSCNTDKNEDPKTNVDERLDNIDTKVKARDFRAEALEAVPVEDLGKKEVDSCLLSTSILFLRLKR